MKKPVDSSSERQQWERILQCLVGMLKKQESHVETLIDDRKLLEDYLNIEHHRWLSKIRLLQSQISQIKEEEGAWKSAHEAKLELSLGLKEKEVECYKEHLGLLKSDLDDFFECVETLCQQNKELKKKLEHDNGKKADSGLMGGENSKQNEESTSLEGKLSKLRHEFKILTSKKEAEVTYLLAEKNFIWNQFKKTDEDYTNLRKSKKIELEQANEAAEKLQHMIDKLQSAVTEKDDTIANLEATLSALELDLETCNKEAKQRNEMLAIAQSELDKLRALVNEKDETVSKLKDDLIKHEATSSRAFNETSRLKERAMSIKLRSSTFPSEKSSSGRYKSRSASELERQNRANKNGNFKGFKHCTTSRKRSTCMQERPRLFSEEFKIPKMKDLT